MKFLYPVDRQFPTIQWSMTMRSQTTTMISHSLLQMNFLELSTHLLLIHHQWRPQRMTWILIVFILKHLRPVWWWGNQWRPKWCPQVCCWIRCLSLPTHRPESRETGPLCVRTTTDRLDNHTVTRWVICAFQGLAKINNGLRSQFFCIPWGNLQ